MDPDRTVFPVSGTAVRKDPVGCWEFLGRPCGPPSPGGSSSSAPSPPAPRPVAGAGRPLPAARRRLGADGLGAEYGREYSEEKLAELRAPAARRPSWADVAFTSEEFPRHRAAPGRGRRSEAARRARPVLFCDTDSFATAIWHERYMGGRNEEVERIADRTRRDLYLLTDHADVPFEDDGLRDGEQLRPWMTDRFRAELARTGRRFLALDGDREQRLATAVAAVDALLAEGWHFADPLPENR